MLERLDRAERLTVALTVVFTITLMLTVQTESAIVWVVWGTAMVLLSGTALVLMNRADSPTDEAAD
ncbi:hypothetical protein [Natronorubrum texcoconense]|uniref:Uncharacterized protein n=1 Tax=Natronorubrum texcoconense TaxID=1095776 RepID=A0A1G9ECS0_9EURY|nr:hypothetical protein [Natronorubrum texcoconense]SDK73841.1 hypothetical protein SAMN04515672_3857 [Natronorubrum texcoconense]